jgi:uncharacterized lipoprotein YmbA
MRHSVFALACVLLGSLPSCGSVSIPRENYWRLDLVGHDVQKATPTAASHVLRVQDLQLGNAMSGDFLVVSHGPSRLSPCELDRWVAPLDRLATDALVLSLSRSGSFSLVKGASDGGAEDLTLNGRILDFCEHRSQTGERQASAQFTFWLEGKDGLVFADEFRGMAPIEGEGAEASVKALSLALQQVVDQLASRIALGVALRLPSDATPASPR